jgi:hypothetical protein
MILVKCENWWFKMKDIENIDQQLHVKRMSNAEFKSEITAKGWLMKDVGKRWGIGIVRMSQICSDEERALYYDEAVRALPERRLKS